MKVGVARVARVSRAAVDRLSKEAVSISRPQTSRNFSSTENSVPPCGETLSYGRRHPALTAISPANGSFPARVGIAYSLSISLMEGVCS